MDVDIPPAIESTSAAPAAPASPVPSSSVIDPGGVFDIDQVANQYEGRTKVTRLNYISTSPPFAGPALTLLLSAITSSTLDVNLYENAYHQYRQFVIAVEKGEVKDSNAVGWAKSVKGKEVSIDRAWIERAKKEARTGMDRLESELKGYTTNLIKESTRMGHRDLARFQIRIGDLQGAIRSFTKSREYCSTSQHVLEMCLGIIEVALELSNYSFVRNYVVKAESALEAINAPPASGPGAQRAKAKVLPTNMPGMVAPAQDPAELAKERERLSTLERLKVADGVALLGQGNFSGAARQFTSVGKETLSSQFNHFIPPADIALYAVLTGLATFSRPELKSRLLENADLRPMLDLEPYLKDILRAFYNSQFKVGLDLLTKFRARQALDIHLSPHVNHLVDLITQRALLSYFAPYTTVKTSRMAAAFGFSETHLISRVHYLIQKGDMKARIDSRGGVLVARKKDARTEAFKKGLDEGEEIRRKTIASQLRMKLIKADIVVKGPKSQQQEVY